MAEIIEDYVSFETAKLLKEKRFNEECRDAYHPTDVPMTVIRYHRSPCKNNDLENEDCSSPTLQMAMKWLREVHNILLVVDYIYECTNTFYVYKIYRLGENGKPEREAIMGVSSKDNKEHVVGYRDYKLSYKDYATYKEATEDGIKYCLENLI